MRFLISELEAETLLWAGEVRVPHHTLDPEAQIFPTGGLFALDLPEVSILEKEMSPKKGQMYEQDGMVLVTS